MAKQSGISTPSGFGGLMRYNEEYASKIKIKPSHILVFIILTILFVTALKLFWPVVS